MSSTTAKPTKSERRTAKVFQSGSSQAIRLPKEFRVRGTEVEIIRRNNELVIREKLQDMTEVIALIQQMPADMFEGIRDTRPPEEREEN